MKKYFLAAIFLSLGIQHTSAQDLEEPHFRKTSRKAALYNGPGLSYGRAKETLTQGTPVYFRGLSLNGEWAQIVTYEGKIFWTPYFNLGTEKVEVADGDKFTRNLINRTNMISKFAIQAGAGYGGRPLLTRAGGGLFWNFVPEGLVDFRYDLTEIGITGSYNIYGDVEYFMQFSVLLQWLYRFGEERRGLIGPRIGYAFMNDPTSDELLAQFITGGLNFRYYFLKYVGFYLDADVYARSVVYFSAMSGLTVRF